MFQSHGSALASSCNNVYIVIICIYIYIFSCIWLLGPSDVQIQAAGLKAGIWIHQPGSTCAHHRFDDKKKLTSSAQVVLEHNKTIYVFVSHHRLYMNLSGCQVV